MKPVVMDTIVLIPGIEHESKIEKRIIDMAKRKGKLILLPQNFRELKAERAKTDEGKQRIIEFKRKNRSKVVKVPVSNKEDLSRMPGNRNDQIISLKQNMLALKKLFLSTKDIRTVSIKVNYSEPFCLRNILILLKDGRKKIKRESIIGNSIFV